MLCEQLYPAAFSRRAIQDHYTRLAARYDFWAWLTESRARARCLQLAAIRDGEHVLEVAVGTGLAFYAVVQQNSGGFSVGMDITPAMLAQAQRRAAQVGSTRYALHPADAYNLPYAAHSFDVIINNYLFDLLPKADFPHVLGQFYRVLRPGGRLALVNMTAPWRRRQQIWTALYRRNPRWTGGCRPVTLADALEASGFTLVHRARVSQMTLPSELLLLVKPP
jgi:ubiquinone/menaquinone biosynthesis C-methylase UbiE